MRKDMRHYHIANAAYDRSANPKLSYPLSKSAKLSPLQHCLSPQRTKKNERTWSDGPAGGGVNVLRGIPWFFVSSTPQWAIQRTRRNGIVWIDTDSSSRRIFDGMANLRHNALWETNRCKSLRWDSAPSPQRSFVASPYLYFVTLRK